MCKAQELFESPTGCKNDCLSNWTNAWLEAECENGIATAVISLHNLSIKVGTMKVCRIKSNKWAIFGTVLKIGLIL